jgi:hypothetical protein
VADPQLLGDGRLWMRVGSMTIHVRHVPVPCPLCSNDASTFVDQDRDRFKCAAGHQQEFVECGECRHVFKRLRGQREPGGCPACTATSLRKASAWDWYAWCLPVLSANQVAALEAGEGRNDVPEPVAFRGRVLVFQPTEKGARIQFADTSPQAAYWLIADFLTGGEYVRESGGLGKSTWGRGSSVGRALGGGLVRRSEYVVTIGEVGEIVHLLVESTMSGWGGSVVGVAREQSQRKAFGSRLHAYLNSLAVAAATEKAADSAPIDPGSALERLRELRDRDLLTDEEYASKRAEILARL